MVYNVRVLPQSQSLSKNINHTAFLTFISREHILTQETLKITKCKEKK